MRNRKNIKTYAKSPTVTHLRNIYGVFSTIRTGQSDSIRFHVSRADPATRNPPIVRRPIGHNHQIIFRVPPLFRTQSDRRVQMYFYYLKNYSEIRPKKNFIKRRTILVNNNYKNKVIISGKSNNNSFSVIKFE